nr:Flp family type IVb pilin [Woodsholea maritima]
MGQAKRSFEIRHAARGQALGRGIARSFARHTSALLNRFVRDEKGATAIEYGLMVALFAVAIIGGISVFVDAMNGQAETVTNALNSVTVETQ